MAEWYTDSARALALRLRKRELSSVELVDACLERIAQLNPAIHAVVTLEPERARAEAKRADELLASGAQVGPLHGVPMTIKDAFEVTDVRTTAGAKHWTAHVPKQDALAVRRLRNAGVIVVGKTNTPAFCSDFQSYNDLFGVTKNPWNVDRTPGGSSGGAAAALAARLTPIELGSDIAGSIRIPPAFCGVYGHKTTHAIVPMRGHIPPPPGSLSIPDLLVVGPMARCADDLALMLGLIAGPVPEDANAYALQLPPPRAATLRGYRVAAWLEDPAFPVDAEVAGRLQATVDALRRAGVTVDDAKPDFSLTDAHALYHRLFDPAMIAGSAKTIAQLEAARTVVTDPGFVTLVENSLSRHYEWLDANEKRAKLKAKLRQFFENYDVLLCPVAHVPAFPHDHSHPQFTRSLTVNGQKRPYLELMGWVSFATAVGAPATSAPIGRTKDGLPIGIQIVGSHFEDLTTIHFAGRLAELIGGFEPPPGF